MSSGRSNKNNTHTKTKQTAVLKTNKNENYPSLSLKKLEDTSSARYNQTECFNMEYKSPSTNRLQMKNQMIISTEDKAFDKIQYLFIIKDLSKLIEGNFLNLMRKL